MKSKPIESLNQVRYSNSFPRSVIYELKRTKKLEAIVTNLMKPTRTAPATDTTQASVADSTAEENSTRVIEQDLVGNTRELSGEEKLIAAIFKEAKKDLQSKDYMLRTSAERFFSDGRAKQLLDLILVDTDVVMEKMHNISRRVHYGT
jgi:hypothetical protein